MAFQGLFRRNSEFVVVKPVHLNANETLEVGTVISMTKGNIKWFQLRLWFRRRRIGTKDSEWVKQILQGSRRPEGASISTARDVQKLAETLAAVANGKVDKAPDSAVETSSEQEPAPTEPTAEEKAQAKKDARNKREREKRAAAKAAKAKAK